MAYSFDNYDSALVINGFGNGVAPDPYDGISNMQSVNPSSISGEASVGFSTKSASSAPSFSGIMTSTGVSNLFTVPSGATLEDNQAIYFTASSISNITAGTQIYWIAGTNHGSTAEFSLVNTYGTTVGFSTGTSGTAAFLTYNINQPKFFTEATVFNSSANRTNFMIDQLGQVWSDYILTDLTSSWTYTGNQANSGNSPDATAYGNGLIYWKTANSTSIGDWDGWLFIFRDGTVDYCNVDGINNGTGYNNIGSYHYNWDVVTSTVGTSIQWLYGRNTKNCPHNTLIGTDNTVYFCDKTVIQQFYQANVINPTVNFSPTSGTSYGYLALNVLPQNDLATCLAPLGNNVLIGGAQNQVYLWNTTGTSGTNNQANNNGVIQAILLAESYVKQIVTVNVNAYIFCGNRGNIYITNGSQASPWAKLPDHISGTVEPYFQWGDATYNKDRLYFSANVINNSGSGNQITGYGGVWAIDIPTQIMWLSNQLSYGSYTGYASALFSLPPNPFISPGQVASLPTDPPGSGLLIGWNNSGSFGVDTTVSAPYTNGAAIIESDIIPIGTYTKPRTVQQVEYKLSTPMVAGESISFNYRNFYGDTWKPIKTISYSSSADSNYSSRFPATWKNSQWIQIQAVLTSVTNSPSYVRLKEIRLTGMVGPTIQQNQQLAI